MLKARAISEALGVPAIADDSGIEVDALGGSPVRASARYAGEDATDEQNLEAMMQAMRGSRRAVARPGTGASPRSPGPTDGSSTPTAPARERWSTSVTGSGVRLRPDLRTEGWDETMAQLTDEQKDRISHRGRAFRELRSS
jgi:XTP/dITP diphosphohydrolase